MESTTWGAHSVTNGNAEIVEVPPFRIGLRREKSGVYLTTSRIGDDEVDAEPHLFFMPEDEPLSVRPCLPGLPVVVNFGSLLHILPGHKIKAYIDLPLGVQVVAGSSKTPVVLWEEIARKLSKTWFGNASGGGEAAYSLPTSLHLGADGEGHEEPRIVCGLTISNESRQLLDFERLALRVPHLAVFEDAGDLRTNAVHVRFRGEANESQIDFRARPAGDRKWRQLSPPREPEDKSIIRRSFFFLKTLTMD